MKITFWSPIHGQSGTTSNMIAAAVFCTLLYGQTNMIMQTHFNLNNLEVPFIRKHNKAVGDFFDGDVGLDALARSIKSEPLDKETIFNCSTSLLNQKLNLLPGTTKANKEHYESKLQPVLYGILDAIAKCHDILFIDTNSGLNDAITNKIIDTTDIVVVNLSQSKGILDNYFNNSLFQNKKVLYVIGSYDKNSKYNVTNIRRMYKVKKEDIAVIPYNTEYMDAQSNGNVLEFLNKCIESKKKDVNYEFSKAVKDTSKKLMKKAGLDWRFKHDLFT